MTNRYAFDQQCRVRATQEAAAAGLLDTPARLSINFLPNAVYEPKACIQLTLATAAAIDFPTDRLIFEFTENEEMVDPAHVSKIVDSYRRMGFGTALDDFGAGHAGLYLLAHFQPDIIKLDMELIRGVEANLPKRIIVDAGPKCVPALAWPSSRRAWRQMRNPTHCGHWVFATSRATCSPNRRLNNFRWFVCRRKGGETSDVWRTGR